jgi:addiction module RelB/DinJ family antitoxin
MLYDGSERRQRRGAVMSVQVSTNIDENTKAQFDSVCASMGVTASNVLSMLIKGVVNYNGIPFDAATQSQMKPKMSRESVFGCMRGQFKMTDDFNAPLDDFKEYME